MEKNLLIFVFSILMLNSAPSYADEGNDGLPALPAASEFQEEESGSNSKSLWQKFKEYVGFGEEKKIEEKQPEAPSSVEKQKMRVRQSLVLKRVILFLIVLRLLLPLMKDQ